jgi:hypothetical protein
VAVLAFECYADQDVYLFLRDLGLRLEKRHSYSQGEVINDLLKDRAEIGFVDEDPRSSHHRARDAMAVVHASHDIAVRSREDRHVLVIKPTLEEAFLNGIRRLNVDSALPRHPSELERRLAHPDARHPDHVLFRRELGRLREASLERKAPTFITELEEQLRRLI